MNFKPCLCPACGYFLQATSHRVPNTKPTPGDFSMCLSCGVLLRFTDTMGVRLARAGEAEEELPPAMRVWLTKMQIARALLVPPTGLVRRGVKQ